MGGFIAFYSFTPVSKIRVPLNLGKYGKEKGLRKVTAQREVVAVWAGMEMMGLSPVTHSLSLSVTFFFLFFLTDLWSTLCINPFNHTHSLSHSLNESRASAACTFALF